ncbi:unnamed protein product [Paramecium octaurelia]|uniref:Uncharacterized protein n=1 Tax=Paramecium octaurelia TaxID=43137 RepID=A0A8S1WX42_PAROT|nr:unnamed protein product [Paramecium octaurelia]
MILEEQKPFTTEELYEYRKVLVDWKWRGPDAIYFVLGQLCKGTLEREAIVQSKIYKSVYILRESIRKAPSTDMALYNKDQIATILLKLKSIHNQIKEIISKPPKRENKKTIFSVAKYTDNIQGTQSNIQLGDYLPQDQRDKIRAKLSEYLQKQIQQKQQQDLFQEENLVDKCTKLADALENNLYNKHYQTVAPGKNYSSDLKTLYQYLGKDKSGRVLQKLFEGFFTVNQACQLQLKDWLDEEVIRELENRKISEMKDDDADYYRQIRIKEMTQSKGQECPRCHNNYLYIIETKQIRRADEPATIFYECFACQHRYKV